jgi:hypothetical protein
LAFRHRFVPDVSRQTTTTQSNDDNDKDNDNDNHIDIVNDSNNDHGKDNNRRTKTTRRGQKKKLPHVLGDCRLGLY